MTKHWEPPCNFSGDTSITRAFLLTKVSKKAAYYSVFVKSYLKNYKKLDSTFL